MIYEASKDDFILASAIALCIMDADTYSKKIIQDFINKTSALLYTDEGRAEMYKKKKETKYGDQQSR